LKPVAWRKKMPSDLHQRASLPSELLSLDLTQTIRARKPNSFERILAHRIDCQRARASCPAGKLPNNLMSIGSMGDPVNTHLSRGAENPQFSSGLAATLSNGSDCNKRKLRPRSVPSRSGVGIGVRERGRFGLGAWSSRR